MKPIPFIFLLLIGIEGFSQQNLLTEKDYPVKYKRAVQLFASGNYQLSRDELTPLTSSRFNNAIVPFAHYYHALCSFKLKNYFESRSMLRQLTDRFPDWKKTDDAYFLFADACLAENSFDEAFDKLNKITDSNLRKESLNLQYNYIKKITDLAQLKLLNTRFPSNAIIAEQLVSVIQKQKISSREDLELSDKLTNRFKLGDQTEVDKKKPNKQSNNVVNIAVMLPFKLDEFYPSQTNRVNQYVYDIVDGMKMAKSRLESEGITINISNFDIDRTAEPVNSVIGQTDFENVNLIIGPLYPEANRPISNFTKKFDVVQIHPLSNNTQLVANEKLTLLGQSSFETQANHAIDYILNVNPTKTVAIYFGNTRRDSTFAYIYRDRAMERGFEVVAIKKYLSPESVDSRKTGHVFIVGSEDTFGSKVVNALDRKKVNSPIISTSSAFDFDKGSLSVFNRQLFLLQTDFIDNSKEEVKLFRNDFIANRNITPSYYSYLGYDYVLFFGRMLAKGKENFRKELNGIEFTQGYTLSGFDYTNGAKDNQIVPIVKYQDGKFIQVSQ
jgi:ABC-type branched-subunit amino acid transport system substrate-binding protein